MNKLSKEEMQNMLDVLSKLPAPPKLTNEGTFEGFVTCMACGKPVPIGTARIIRSPYKYKGGSNLITDPICPDCYKDVKDFAMLVCPVSQKVVVRIKPHRDVTGFEFKPRGLYHVDISPGAAGSSLLPSSSGDVRFTSIILEKQQYDKEHKRIIVN